jgi:hypothetical protein
MPLCHLATLSLHGECLAAGQVQVVESSLAAEISQQVDVIEKGVFIPLVDILLD